MADILLAEDDRNVRRIIDLQLRMLGHKVRLAANGAEALEMARQAPPEACIVDLMMPEVDGFALREQLRELPETAAVPCMAVTAMEGHSGRSRAAEVGFDAYLEKPFQVAELRRQVHSLLTGGAA